MDTERTIPMRFIDDSDTIDVADISSENLKVIKDYIEINRQVTELYQLFKVFHFNLEALKHCFVLNIDDTVIKNPNCPTCDCDYIALNALVINYISSAKTLIESLQKYAAINLKVENGENKDVFNKYVSELYDNDFNYRFLIRLRDFMQHGHLPVSCSGTRYCFDVMQILDTPHFNHNKTIAEDMQSLLDELSKLDDRIPCLALTMTLADFAIHILCIYKTYLSYIKNLIVLSKSEVDEIIERNPEYIYHGDNVIDGMVIYDKDKTYHAYNPSNDPIVTFEMYQKDVENIYLHEKHLAENLWLGFKEIEMQ